MGVEKGLYLSKKAHTVFKPTLVYDCEVDLFMNFEFSFLTTFIFKDYLQYLFYNQSSTYFYVLRSLACFHYDLNPVHLNGDMDMGLNNINQRL